jgi:hypothetical protein
VPEPLGFMDACDDALLHRIASHVDGLTLARVRRVSRRLRRVADSDDLWRRLCVERFNVAPDSRPPTTWADVYKFNMEVFYSLLLASSAADAVGASRSAVLHSAAAGRLRLPGYGFALA